MSIERRAANFIKMSDEVWSVHENPWSVWTRYTCLPLLALAIWSRTWIGVYAIIPFILACIWTWLNPRIFSKPSSTNHWASKAVIGERVLLSLADDEIPAHHNRALANLKILNFFVFFLTLYGLWALHPVLTVFGTFMTMVAKTWFLDRMVWLLSDMEDKKPEFKKWLY